MLSSLEPVYEAAKQLPITWTREPGNVTEVWDALVYAPSWAEGPREQRKQFVAEVATSTRGESLAALFLLWNWEPDPILRAELVEAMGAFADQGSIAVLRYIMRKEPADEGGRAVRARMKPTLERLASISPGSSEGDARKPVRSRSPEITTRGVSEVRTSRQEALAALRELEALDVVRRES